MRDIIIVHLQVYKDIFYFYYFFFLLGQSSKPISPLLESGFPYLAGCYMGSLVGGLNTL